MEKQAQAKPKIKILKFLPKAANSAVTFTNPSYSPGREKRFSGPIISIIPIEARRKTNYGIGFDTPQEPTSPKISCMGQIKHKKKMHKKKLFASKILQPAAVKPPKPAAKLSSSSSSSSKIQEPIKPKLADAAASRSSSSKELKKQTSVLSKIFHHGAKLKPAGRKSDASSDDKPKMMTDRAPSLSQMNRFASGRDAFVGFDWTTVHQIAPVDSDHHRNFYSDDEESGDSEGEDIIIPFSAPILMGSGGHGGGGRVTLEPRKEINLWKRRTMAPPRPLQLNVRSK